MDARAHHIAKPDKPIPLGSASQRDLDALRWDFRRVYPVDEAPCFANLLRAIDEADA